MAIKLLLVDDHTLFREGLRRILELEPDMQVVDEAADGLEAMACLSRTRPDVILMDINMPGCNGVEATKRIKAALPQVAILMLTIHDDNEYLFEVLRAGAAGYLLKDVEPTRLVEAIRTVARGGSVVNPSLTNKLIMEFSRLSQPMQSEDQVLSSREQEVLHLMAQGLPNRDIAQKLYISEKTVKNHVSSILRKLDVTDRTQAVVQGVKMKLVKIS
jgi:DNA-binding NarL/FixJ family response regulator